MRKRKNGEPVFYGQEICLMHSESGMFITALPKCTLFGNNSSKVRKKDKETIIKHKAF